MVCALCVTLSSRAAQFVEASDYEKGLLPFTITTGYTRCAAPLRHMPHPRRHSSVLVWSQPGLPDLHETRIAWQCKDAGGRFPSLWKVNFGGAVICPISRSKHVRIQWKRKAQIPLGVPQHLVLLRIIVWKKGWLQSYITTNIMPRRDMSLMGSIARKYILCYS